MVAQRSSQNKIVSLFERLRQSNGWEIVKVEKLPKVTSDRKWKDAQQDLKERRILGILEARELDDSEYIELAADRDRGAKLPKADKFALERHELEKAYPVLFQ